MHWQLMQQISKFFLMAVLFLQAAATAASGQVSQLTFFDQAAGHLRIDLAATPSYRYFTLQNPGRLVVDFKNTPPPAEFQQPPLNHPYIVGVRWGVRNKTDLRLVVELNTNVDVSAVAVKQGKGLQLQFDMNPNKNKSAANKPVTKQIDSEPANAVAAGSSRVAKSEPAAKPALGRDIVIAIDAGHGGKDVGAQGPNGTQEKDVVLAIAKRLEKAVNKQPGMKAVMIRNGDYFVKLDKRSQLARQAKADLFVSIHADSFDDPSAHGASVYTWAAKNASDKTAQYLADSENAADRFGGAEVHNDALASVLMDLTNKAAKDASHNIANKVLRQVKSVGHLHRKNLQKANFVVLKSPVPSILVETAFISNPEEERRLNSPAYQDQMASAVFGGIMAHFKQYAPADTLFAQLQKGGKKATRIAAAGKPQAEVVAKAEPAAASATPDKVVTAKAEPTQHVISSGETLFGIARQYGVTIRDIRNVNGMDDTPVKVGQVLHIPRSS